MGAPYRIVGVPASPYSRKMRAVMRCRRLPHQWVLSGSPGARNLPPVPVPLLPILVFPARGNEPAEAMIDSTFQIRRLEESHTERALVPPNPALAFLDALIEDYADEWLTKAMFHYRWAFDPDIEKAKTILPLFNQIGLPEEQWKTLGDVFSKRQIDRLSVVGSNAVTGPIIEESYRRLLGALDAHLAEQPFVMGRRPGTADFGLFGQLTQLVLFDPTSAGVVLEAGPRVYAWCEIVEDLSGLEIDEGGWLSPEELPGTFIDILGEVGRVYPPFLLANAAALDSGADQVECTIDGQTWKQEPFPYQGKCLTWLRASYAALAPGDRAQVDGVLAGTGCEALFA